MEVLLARGFGDSTLKLIALTAVVALLPLGVAPTWGQQLGAPSPPPGASSAPSEATPSQRSDPRPHSPPAEVCIGYFGPSDPDDPRFGSMWRAAQAAIRDANGHGGYHGQPFRLVPAWSEDPWGTGVRHLMQLVYRRELLAVIGGVDGASTHLAEQVAAKALLPLVSPLATDTTVNRANVPWMFSLAPGDHLIARALAPRIVDLVGENRPWVLCTANDHDSFLLTRQLRQALDQRGLVPTYQFEFRAADGPSAELIERCVQAHPACVVVMADPDHTAQLIRLLRRAGFRQWIVAGPSAGRESFLHQVGDAAGPLVYPVLTRPSAKVTADSSLEADADWAARQTYDAVQITIAAIRRAGLDRSAIRDALKNLAPWNGVAGTVQWDRHGGNTRRVTLGTIKPVSR